MFFLIETLIIAVIYGSLPEANLEIGLQALEKAEEIENDFYSKNKVLIAKTLVALNRNIPRAKSLLISVIGKYKNSDKWDDLEVRNFNDLKQVFIFIIEFLFYRPLKKHKKCSKNLELK